MSQLDQTKAEIVQRVDYLLRVSNGTQRQFDRCRKAANALAQTVYAFTEDPQGVGTDALREAWQTFVQQDAGNFSSDPEPVLSGF